MVSQFEPWYIRFTQTNKLQREFEFFLLQSFFHFKILLQVFLRVCISNERDCLKSETLSNREIHLCRRLVKYKQFDCFSRPSKKLMNMIYTSLIKPSLFQTILSLIAVFSISLKITSSSGMK